MLFEHPPPPAVMPGHARRPGRSEQPSQNPGAIRRGIALTYKHDGLTDSVRPLADAVGEGVGVRVFPSPLVHPTRSPSASKTLTPALSRKRARGKEGGPAGHRARGKEGCAPPAGEEEGGAGAALISGMSSQS